MHIEEKQLKEFILGLGLVSKSDFFVAEKIAEKSGTNIGDVLVKNGKLSSDDLRMVKAQVLSIPFVDLKGQKISFNTLSIIPEPISRGHNIVAFNKNEGFLEVALIDIDDLSAVDFLKQEGKLKILPRFTDTESLKGVLLQYQKILNDEFGNTIRQEYRMIEGLPNEDGGSAEGLRGESMIKIVETLLRHAVLQKASDMHIEPIESQISVRYRIDGRLKEAMFLPKSIISGITSQIKILSGLQIAEKNLPQDGRFEMDIDGRPVAFRVSTMPTFWGEKIVIRILINPVSGFSLEAIGFHGDGLEEIYKSLRAKTGMILSVGPSGSGKSTTMYTIMDILNTPDVSIATIEDPIEYKVNRVNQTQVKPEIGLDFVSGLRAIVRQDPDIIMVGDMPHKEVIDLAMNIALKGDLVLSTFNAPSSAVAIVRLLDMGIEPTLITSALNVIVSRRLVGKLGDDREEYFLDKSDIKSIERLADLDKVLHFLKKERFVEEKSNWSTIPFYKSSAGVYKGKVSINEVLKISPSIKELILKGAFADDIEKLAKKEGMMTMLEDGIFKAALGLTTIDEVLKVAAE